MDKKADSTGLLGLKVKILIVFFFKLFSWDNESFGVDKLSNSLAQFKVYYNVTCIFVLRIILVCVCVFVCMCVCVCVCV